MDNAMFYMAHVSLIMICLLFVVIMNFKVRNKLRNYFIAYLIELFIWTFSVIMQKYCVNLGYDQWIIIFEDLTYFGIAFISVTMFMIGRAFAEPNSKSAGSVKTVLVCIIPMLTQIVIWTNPLHKWFYVEYFYNDPVLTKLGWYFYVHTVYSYGCLMLAMYYIIKFALHSKGKSYWQAILISVGSITPIAVNICYTFGWGNFTIFSTPIAFMITIFAYFWCVFRYDFLRITPIAMRTVIDRTSDLYIVIDEYMNIIDYNEPFFKLFSNLMHLKKNFNVIEALTIENKTGVDVDQLCAVIENCRDSRTLIHKDLKLVLEDEIKYYSAEFTPLIIESAYCGCILLLRDITQSMRDMEEIKRNQSMLIERERLASLGQLMGGIAHNLKTPIMAISGRTESISVLIDEYVDSLSDGEVTIEDHLEIAKEMRQEIDKIRNHMAYISDIITAVKDQTVKFNAGTYESFTIGELIKRVNILMQHELIRHNCELVYEILASKDFEVRGDINALVQIVDNIIMNSIQAYNSKGSQGKIRFKIAQTQKEIIFMISDDAGGIPKDVQEKLFRQMITTKGKDGTGLGLYISFSTIIGVFGGKMWFNSIEGQGTEFIVSLPFKPNAKEDKDS